MNEKLVSFEEAMTASKEGKIVRFGDNYGCFNTVFNYDDPLDTDGISINSFKDLIEGKWYILN